jgi:serine/threonine protein phosphatase PrpC
VNFFKKAKDLETEDFQGALFETFLAINESLLTGYAKRQAFEYRKAHGILTNEDIESGCTANVVLIYKDRIFCANAGDSRSVIKMKNRVMPMSRDHKPEDENERMRIEKAGGFVSNEGRVNGSLNLSRAIGDLRFKKYYGEKMGRLDEQIISPAPEIKQFSLTDDAMIVMGCDGIWECLSDETVIKILKEKCKDKISRGIEEFFDKILASDVHCKAFLFLKGLHWGNSWTGL